MKRFICLMIFAVVVMVGLPEQSAGSGSPPDRVGFVVDQPSMDLQVLATDLLKTANYELTFEGCKSFEMAVLPRKGGFVADQGLFLEMQVTWLNDKNATSNLSASTMVRNYDFRLCRYTKLNENQVITKNIESRDRSTIRADSRV